VPAEEPHGEQSLRGRVVLITGAGRGLGRATALRLAREGGRLGLLARTAADLEQLSREVRDAGGEPWALAGSVTDEAALKAAVGSLEAAWGGLDALVNCAGTGSFAPVEEVPPPEFRRIVEVNLTGTFLACQAVLPGMLRRGGGQIINVISIAGKVALPNASAYCASKWGALGFTRVLAAEARKRGIRVTALCPGSIATPFWDTLDHRLDLNRMLRAEDVAEMIRFLLAQPAGIHTDELELMPPDGIL